VYAGRVPAAVTLKVFPTMTLPVAVGPNIRIARPVLSNRRPEMMLPALVMRMPGALRSVVL
jgi:hypothetical protein